MHIAHINVCQRTADARVTAVRENFPADGGEQRVVPAKIVARSYSHPTVNWQQLTNFPRPFHAATRARRVSNRSARRLFERGKHSRANLPAQCVQQSWKLFMLRTRQTRCKMVLDDELLTLSRFRRDVKRDDQQIWDVYCESGVSEVLKILLKWRRANLQPRLRLTLLVLEKISKIPPRVSFAKRVCQTYTYTCGNLAKDLKREPSLTYN